MLGIDRHRRLVLERDARSLRILYCSERTLLHIAHYQPQAQVTLMNGLLLVNTDMGNSRHEIPVVTVRNVLNTTCIAHFSVGDATCRGSQAKLPLGRSVRPKFITYSHQKTGIVQPTKHRPANF